MPSLIFLSAGMDQASPSKLCANAVTSKSLNPRDALDAVVILSGAEGDKKLAGDPNADPLQLHSPFVEQHSTLTIISYNKYMLDAGM